MEKFLSFKEYCRRFDKSLDESRKSYSRFINHMKNDPFIIFMSVDKSPLWLGLRIAKEQGKTLTNKEARELGKRTNALTQDGFKTQLRNRNIGYVAIDGGYKELDPDTKRLIPVDEQSFIIYTNEDNKDNILKFCLEKAKETLQDTIMIVEKNKAKYIHVSDGREEYVGEFSFSKLNDYWSRLHKNSNHERYISFQKDVTKASKQVERFVNMINEED